MNSARRFFSSVALLAATGLTQSAAFACATCGCSLSTDAAMGYSATSGWSIGVDYSYINQSQYRSGSGSIAPEQVANVAGQEVEKQTINRYLTLGVGYSPSADWNFRLLVPYVNRDHSTYSNTETLPLTPDQVSAASVDSFGDIKFIASYQGILPTHNFGVQVGVKLPTGNYGGQATGPVAGNPVYFGAAGNAGGTPLDTSLQAGNGSTDIILGAYYYQPVSQNFDAFVNGQYQRSVSQKLGQAGADYRPGDTTTVSFGLRYEADPDITPQLQVNITHKGADSGALADPIDVEGVTAYLSPGVSFAVGHHAQVYGFVQLPVYSYLSGYQLFPHYTATVGVNYHF
jgi:hypothetical protein